VRTAGDEIRFDDILRPALMESETNANVPGGDPHAWLAGLNRAILDSALDCIITMDAGGRVVEFNPAAERVFGYTREEAVGQELAELIIPENRRRSGPRPPHRNQRASCRWLGNSRRAGDHAIPHPRRADFHSVSTRHHQSQAGGGSHSPPGRDCRIFRRRDRQQRPRRKNHELE
jgi:PAS domain-containing protein